MKFPEGYNTFKVYHISNYGRVKETLPCGAVQFKRRKIYKNQIFFSFSFPASCNDGERKLMHVRATHLMAEHWISGYEKGCYVVHKDWNRLNNYYRNLMVCNQHEGLSHVASGKVKDHPQFLVNPPEEEEEIVTVSHKVEVDNDYFKPVVGFPNYEINRVGVIRKRKAPFIGRILKTRKHPDQFWFVDLRDRPGHRCTVYIHKAVAMAWNINTNPELQTVVVHLDGDTLNNHADNLEWMSPSGAMKLQFKHKKRDNRKSWKTRKKLYGNGFKKKKKAIDNEPAAI